MTESVCVGCLQKIEWMSGPSFNYWSAIGGSLDRCSYPVFSGYAVHVPVDMIDFDKLLPLDEVIAGVQEIASDTA